MKTWDEMNDYQRRGWLHQNVFGVKFWTQKRGEYAFVVSTRDDGREPWTASKYPKPEEYTPIDSSEFDFRVHCGLDSLPNYTTNPRDEYLVLCQVRERWANERHNAFVDILKAIWSERRKPCKAEILMYEPGDYSHAAYLALTGATQ